MAGVNPNIEYARPLEISSAPFQAYLRSRENAERNRLAQQKLNMQDQQFQQKMMQQRQSDIEKRLHDVTNLGQYNIGGLWQDQQHKNIQDLQDQIARKIYNNEPYQEDLIKGVSNIEAFRKKADSYDKMVGQLTSLYGKDKTINPASLRSYIVDKTAMNPDGTLKDLNDINLADLENFNPLVQPDADSIIDNAALADRMAGHFSNNTTTTDTSNRANGITTQRSTTITAPAYTRIDPITGKRSLNTEAIQANPELAGQLFDDLRTPDGRINLIKNEVYQQALNDPALRYKIIREINNHNQGLKPEDPEYIEPNSPDADLIGRSVLTNLLAGKEHGNFRLKKSYGQNKGISEMDSKKGSSGGKTKTDTEDDIIQRFKGVMEQNPNYLENNRQSRLSNPVTGNQVGDIIDVTPLFKNFNIGSDEKGKGLPAPHIAVMKGQPGSIFIDYGPDIKPEVVTLQQLPQWLNQKVKYNKNMDALKLNEEIKKVFGTNGQEQNPSISPVKKAVQTVKDTIRNVVNPSKWGQFMRK